MRDGSSRCQIFHATVLATEGGAMLMQFDKKLQLLKEQVQKLAVEFVKTGS